MADPVVYPDTESAVVDVLQDLLATWAPDATCSTGVPADWAGSSPHIQVAVDGTPVIDHPFRAWPTVRVTVHGAPGSPTATKALATLAQGLLCAHRDATIRHAKALTGVLHERDPETNAELASFTCRVNVRSEPAQPITGS